MATPSMTSVPSRRLITSLSSSFPLTRCLLHKHRPLPVRTHTRHNSHSHPQTRHASTRPRTQPPTKPSQPPTTRTRETYASPSAKAYLTHLLQTAPPTTPLYTAPRSRTLPLTALFFGVSTLAFGAHSLSIALLDPTSVLGAHAPWFARAAFLGPGAMGLGLGVYVLNAGRRHVASLSAAVVPGGSGSGRARRVVLDFAPRRYFAAPRAPVRLELGDVRLVDSVASRRTIGVMGHARTPQGLRAISAEELQRTANRAPAEDVRGLARVAWSLNRFLSLFRRLFARDGLLRVLVRLPGQKRMVRYVMDVDEGWLAEGDALEKCCPVVDESSSS